MKEYLAALLPRLQQFSKSLNDTALLAEHPWVFLDGDGRRITYVFRGGGELLVTDRGEAVREWRVYFSCKREE